MANHSKHNQPNRDTARRSKSGRGRNKSAGSVRIVAGDWRGRKIPVVLADGLRPTGDRVRETLFSWLQLAIPGSRCLDLYAGSGALGLEAASRGASSVTLVESATLVADQLQKNLNNLGARGRVQLHHCTAEQFLATSPAPYDVVFIDPPFDQQVHLAILTAITPQYLTNNALLYIELPTSQNQLVEKLPKSLAVLKQKRFGDVTVLLLQFSSLDRMGKIVAP